MSSQSPDVQNSVQEINQHLDEAFKHMRQALTLSIRAVQENDANKTPIGRLWEQFLGTFFQLVRAEGKQHKMNLLGWISFTSFWKS